MHSEDTQRDRKALEIFSQALERADADVRAGYLDGVCAGDSALRARVEGLLAHHVEDSFLQQPAAGAGPDIASGPTPAVEQPGDRIGRYRLLEKIGEGGMGVVYMAEQEEPVRRMVALKVIRPGMDSQSVIARFEAERQALALMDHPNIARVLDAGTTGEGSWKLEVRSQKSEGGSQRSEVRSQKSEVKSQRSEVGGKRSEEIGGQNAAVGPAPSGFQTPPAEAHPTSDLRPPTSAPSPASDPGRPFFVMELVRGIRITDYCAEHRLSTRDRLDLFIAVCSAVQHAHQKGIIHRDLKPSNILVTEIDGRPVPKVIDFGIARATGQRLTDKTLFTQFAQFIGTPAYMSPEQAALSGTDIDTRSDVYSLGVLLYELLTGTTPFDARDLLEAGFDEMRRIIRETEPPRPSTRLTQSEGRGQRTEDGRQRTEGRGRKPEVSDRKSALPSDLDWIVMKCLEKDRARRYETAIGLAQDIGRHLASEPVTARPPSTAYRLRKLVRRNKLAVAAGAAVAAALIVGLGVSTWMFVRERQARSQERQALDRAVAAEKLQSKERLKAESEGEKSRQVAQFLKDMLKGVAPSVALGDDTKMLRKILDETAERIGADLENQPEVEAELRTVMGKVYGALGDYEKAAAMLGEALALTKQLRGEEHKEVVYLLNAQAQVLGQQGELEDAETMLREALAMERKLVGEDADTSTSLNNLAQSLSSQGRYSEAEKILREALAMCRKFMGNDHPDVATSLNNLGAVLERQQKFGEAETALREALAIVKNAFGSEHPDVAITLNNLANVVQESSLEESEMLFREILSLQRKLLGNAHPNVAAALNGLALALHHQGRSDEAEPMLREGVEIEKNARSAPHPQTSTLIGNLGLIMEGRGKLDEAESLYREALVMLGQLPGPKHPAMTTWRNRLYNLFNAQEMWPEQEAVMREVLESARRVASGDGPHPAVAEALIYLAFTLARQQEFPEAEARFLDGYEALQQNPADWRDLQHEALSGLVLLYEAWEKPDKATEWREKLAAFDKADAARKGESKDESSKQ